MSFLIPSSGVKPVLTFLDTNSSTAASGFSFGSVNFGTEDPNRYIIVISALGGASSEATACTVGGVSANRAANGGGTRRVQVFIANVPTGTSGTVTLNNSGNGAGIIVYSATPLFSTAEFDEQVTPGGSLVIPSGGFGIGGGYTSSAGAATVTWTDGLVGDQTVTWNTGGINFRIRSGILETEGTFTVDVSVSASPPGFATASFGI